MSKKKLASEILNFNENSTKRTPTNQLKRAMLECGFEEKCAHCGEKEGLEINHINGNKLNNNSLNLEFLCRNCHGKTPDFGGKGNKKMYERASYYAHDGKFAESADLEWGVCFSTDNGKTYQEIKGIKSLSFTGQSTEIIKHHIKSARNIIE